MYCYVLHFSPSYSYGGEGKLKKYFPLSTACCYQQCFYSNIMLLATTKLLGSPCIVLSIFV